MSVVYEGPGGGGGGLGVQHTWAPFGSDRHQATHFALLDGQGDR